MVVAIKAGENEGYSAPLSAGLGNQPIDVGLLDSECFRPLRAIVQEFRPRTLFDIPLNGIGEHLIDTAVFSLCRKLDFREQGFGK